MTNFPSKSIKWRKQAKELTRRSHVNWCTQFLPKGHHRDHHPPNWKECSASYSQETVKQQLHQKKKKVNLIIQLSTKTERMIQLALAPLPQKDRIQIAKECTLQELILFVRVDQLTKYSNLFWVWKAQIILVLFSLFSWYILVYLKYKYSCYWYLYLFGNQPLQQNTKIGGNATYQSLLPDSKKSGSFVHWIRPTTFIFVSMRWETEERT